MSRPILCAFDPNQRKLAVVGGFDNIPRIWEVSTAHLQFTLKTSTPSSSSTLSAGPYVFSTLAWSPTSEKGITEEPPKKKLKNLSPTSSSLGREIIGLGTTNGTILLWDVETNSLYKKLEIASKPIVLALSFASPSNSSSSYLYAITTSHKLLIWTLPSGQQLLSLEERYSAPISSNSIVTTDLCGVISVSPQDTTHLLTSSSISALSGSSTSMSVSLSSSGSAIKEWNVTNNYQDASVSRKIMAHTNYVTDIKFLTLSGSSSNYFLTTSNRDRFIYLFSTSPSSSNLTSNSNQKAEENTEIMSGAPLQAFVCPERAPDGINVSRLGLKGSIVHFLAYSREDRAIYIFQWDIPRSQSKRTKNTTADSKNQSQKNNLSSLLSPDNSKKTQKPQAVIRIVSDENQIHKNKNQTKSTSNDEKKNKNNNQGGTVLSVEFCKEDETSILVSMGHPLKPVFKKIRIFDASGKLIPECVISCPTQSAIVAAQPAVGSMASSSGSVAPVPALAGPIPNLQAETRKDLPRTESMETEERGEEESGLSLAERLEALKRKRQSTDEHDENLRLIEENSQKNTLLDVILQGLRSEDFGLLNECLRVEEVSVIKNTVSSLPSSYILKLLKTLLSIAIDSRQPRSNSKNYSYSSKSEALVIHWLQAIFDSHLTYLVSTEGAVQELSQLYQYLNLRLSSWPKLMKLDARLGIVLAHSVKRTEEPIPLEYQEGFWSSHLIRTSKGLPNQPKQTGMEPSRTKKDDQAGEEETSEKENEEENEEESEEENEEEGNQQENEDEEEPEEEAEEENEEESEEENENQEEVSEEDDEKEVGETEDQGFGEEEHQGFDEDEEKGLGEEEPDQDHDHDHDDDDDE